ncbi:MAG TPA: hypothetical protein VF169_06010 [Albitalea sp.]|uniref:hypothetical protein n=1 Tax=Piscinibacter sp. TaxID=1903157 RepID=UPI002ED2FEDA
MPFASRPERSLRLLSLAALLSALAACGGGGSDQPDAAAADSVDAVGAESTDPALTDVADEPVRDVQALGTVISNAGTPPAGYAGGALVPAAARAAAITTPTTVIGNGTPASCTSEAVVSAVAKGGVITFRCGAQPVKIYMTATAKVFNNKPDVVLDGGGLVTLSGQKKLRVLYQNTCDQKQVWTSSRCDLQDSPKLTVQNITFVDGNSAGQTYGRTDVEGGGAIFVRGGRLKVVNARFFRNECQATGAAKGGALRATGMSAAAPVYIVGSSFGGATGFGNHCSAGGAISGLAASFSLYNTLMSHNEVTGGPTTGGGGGGGAIAQDGNTMDLSIVGSYLHDNKASEGGGAIFYTSNNRTGTMSITNSVLHANLSVKYETAALPGIFVQAKPGQPVITGSTITK